MDSGKWDDHINPQVFCTGVLAVLVLVFKYVVMRNFALNENQSYQMIQFLNNDEIDSRVKLESKFSKSYYAHPDLICLESNSVDRTDDPGLEEEKKALVRNNENP